MLATSGLSAVYFPHIIDRILVFLCDDDPFTAANLQTVSRDWHAKIKNRIFAHVWISQDGPPNTTFTIGSIPLPPAASLRFSVPFLYAGYRNQIITDLGDPVVIAALGTARVLDIRDIPLRALLPLEADWVKENLQMIRISPKANEPTPLPPIETLVLFKRSIEHPLPMFSRVLSFTYSLSAVAEFAKKVVIHVQDTDYHPFKIPDRDDLPDTLENVAVFYPFAPAYTMSPLYDWARQYASIVHIIERHFSNNGSVNNPSRTLTFISPALNDRHLAIPPEPSWNYIQRGLQNGAPHLLANVEFLTAAEYRQRVGEETYDLHAYMDTQ